jgi:hypothetical protein
MVVDVPTWAEKEKIKDHGPAGLIIYGFHSGTGLPTFITTFSHRN